MECWRERICFSGPHPPFLEDEAGGVVTSSPFLVDVGILCVCVFNRVESLVLHTGQALVTWLAGSVHQFPLEP